VTDRIQGRALIVDADYNTLGTLSRALGHEATTSRCARTDAPACSARWRAHRTS
jgi:hypothetical protein